MNVEDFPEVQAWLEPCAVFAHRYRCLVLQGPSRLGKTVVVRTLAPEGFEVLEPKCAAGTEPDLRAYRLTRHGLLLLDEIRADVVATQRELFQGHSYTVFVHRKRMVLASNAWHPIEEVSVT